jgi:chromosome segregation ATPase
MDVKLQNAYVEVLLGNFMEVVKQNLMFQAQLEVGKQTNSDADGVRRKIQELSERNVELQKNLEEFKRLNENANDDKQKLIHLTTKNIELESNLQEKEKILSKLITEHNNVKSTLNEKESALKQKESQVVSAASITQDRDRLQNAVNDVMRQLKSAKEELLKSKSESQDVLIKNNNRIEELTKYVTRLEAAIPAVKLKKVKLGESTQTDSPETTENVENGGTF